MPRIILPTTKINKESLTTKLTLIIIGLTAGSALLFPATYASFHPVTSGEIADGTIQSVDIGNGQVRTEDIGTGQVRTGDILDGQVFSVDIRNGQVGLADIQDGAIPPNILFITSGPQTILGATTQEARATCPDGMVVTGGGFDTNSFDVRIADSFPIALKQWVVSAFNSGSRDDATFEAYALCLGRMG
jgi:hypothetical protein